MKKTNEFRLTLDARSVNEGFARVAVSAFAAPLDPTLEELADLKTAVSEAVTNCIVHGYKDCCGKIYIHTVLLDPPAVRVTVRDKGCGIADVPQAMTPLYTTGEGERAGLGFTVMESFCDKLRVTSKPGKGTTVVLEKRITGKQKWKLRSGSGKSERTWGWCIPLPIAFAGGALSTTICTSPAVWG